MYKAENRRWLGRSYDDWRDAGRVFLAAVPWKRLLRIIWWMPVAAALYLLILIITYAFFDPPTSMFMAAERYAGKKIVHGWTPINRISRHMPVAVIMAEDNKYCSHFGVDWGELRHVLLSSRSKVRGASTITMQTVKNLFLWPERSYVRKAIELPVAHIVSLFWSKRRQMEIYLNIVEFAPGVYGVEAASWYHFKKRASQLTKREAALLAAVLPNPDGRNAGRPGPKTRAVARRIQVRMKAGPRYTKCVRR